MISMPGWMMSSEVPYEETPPGPRAVVDALEGDGIVCAWAGHDDGWGPRDVYLLRTAAHPRTARLTVASDGAVELWERLDPNGAPQHWGRVEAADVPDPTALAELVRGWWGLGRGRGELRRRRRPSS